MRPPVRVLQVLGNSAGGIARHVASVVEALGSDDRFDVSVAAPGGLPVDIPNVSLEIAIPDGVMGHRTAVRHLRHHVTTSGYEVIHAHGLRAGLDAGRAAARSGAYRILTVHNLVRSEVTGRWRAPVYRLAEPLALAVSDHVFAVSDDIGSSLQSWRRRNPVPIEVLHLGAGAAPRVERSRAEIRLALGVGPEDDLIVTVARLSIQKRLDVLLDALSMLPKATLAVLGEGPLGPELHERAREWGIASRVRWLGFRPDAADHIAAADLFCLSSVWEGIPLAAMEAIALGTPVVATAVGGMTELIQDGASAWLVPFGDAGALAAALGSALGAPEEGKRRAKAARARLEIEFSADRMLERLATRYLAAVHVD